MGPVTLSNTYICQTSLPHAIKFYLKHYCRLPALDFELDQMRTRVCVCVWGGGGGGSVATDRSHRVIMEKRLPR